MLTCKRCGKCCYFLTKDGIKKCRFLIILPSGKCLCRVYKTRIGRRLGKGIMHEVIICVNSKDFQYDYPGCPYNTGKPLFPI